MDKGKYTGLIFTDLKKTFDIVDHAILLKTENDGVNGVNMNGLHPI